MRRSKLCKHYEVLFAGANTRCSAAGKFITEEAIENIARICGVELEEIPHHDTINDVFKNIDVKEIEKMSGKKSEKAKQDCEINAFKRLAKKIKKNFPKLNIVISGDALYAKSTVIDICKEYGWKYIIRFKEGSIPTLYKEFEEIAKKYSESKIERYELVNSIEYKENKTNVIRYKKLKKALETEEVETEFTYITDLPIRDKNIEETVYLGRKRWKIENEGFNIQKNGTLDIGHLFSKNENAIKVHYLLIQMAHLLRQLLEKGSTKIKELKLKLKEVSQKIKTTLTSKITKSIEHKRIQLRFYG